ncbi:uncharacterized protein LOC132302559 isoform X2 [Cornus florida]|uniref:uncharacterized protein LOC132302559 isoform X2 n=1 Tax=Cornus florida TaxID=4283 RepID=UPI002898A481|nr:uncharacterized protein LOC132302559 isoform X2 [Cornus florida]
MGRAAKERLNRALSEHLNTIHETFQVLDQTPASSLTKVSWNEVIQLGEQLSKQATTVGMLWTGETPEIKALEENMAAYFNTLQGFLLLSHGSIVGAGSRIKDGKLSIPQLVGTIWDACSALKKTPATNITAIGRAMTQVAVSMKDVLREMKELKPASDPADETCYQASVKAEKSPHDSDDSCEEDDLGNDLSPEEMKIAQLAMVVVSEMLVLIKELIRSITGLLKQENLDNSSDSVNALERLLKLCQEIGEQVDELGACLYPPQEAPVMKAASEKISSIVDEMQVDVENLNGSSEAFFQACIALMNSLEQFKTEVESSSPADDLIPKIQNLDVNN